MLLPVLACPPSLAAQNADRVVFRHLNKKDGLAQSSVFAIAQDSLGYLWFGTRGGLNKYDGYRFSLYKNDPNQGPGSSDMRTLYVDPLDKTLWAGSLSSLSRYEEKADSFTTFRNEPGNSRSLTGGAIGSMHRDRSGRFWVGTSRGLNLLNESDGTWRRHFPGPGEKEHPANHIAFISDFVDGLILVGTRQGLFVLDAASSSTVDFEHVDAIGEFRLTACFRDAAGVYWFGTSSNGVLKWTPETGKVERFSHDKTDAGSLSHNSVRTLTGTPSGDLWVGTFNGLNHLKPGASKFIRHENSGDESGGLLDNSIRSLLVDHSGSLWVGTYYGGVNHLDERYNRFANYRHDPNQNSLSGNVVSSFAEMENGDLWIGTEGDGLNFRDRRTGEFTVYRSQTDGSNRISGNNVKQILPDGDQLWVGTFQAGLNRLDLKNRRFTQFRHDPDDPTSLGHDNVYGIHREGNLLWTLTFGAGLDVMDLETGVFRHFPYDSNDPNSISSNEARVILKSHNGSFWIGTENGLNHVRSDASGYPVSFTRLFAREKIYSLYEDDQHYLWLGTFSNGLYRYDPATKTTEHFTTFDGLPGNTIFGILDTEGGILWLSTDNGLSRFDPSGLSFTNFDYSHGLENLEYNFNAYHKTSNEELLFGGLNGYTRFAPAELTPNTFVPPLVITSLRRNNQEEKIGQKGGLLTCSINNTKTLTFGYNEAAFTIQFAALDYFSPENNRYAYMLEGLDRDWNYSTGKGEASYTIQREGDYTFLLKGANSDGVWNQQARRLNIRVLPPFWRTWWAYLFYFAMAALTVYALVHFLRLRHKIQLQEIAQRQQDELLEIKLRFFTNITHEFRTPLTLILGPLQQLLKKNDHHPENHRQLSVIDRNAQRLLNLVNQVLTFRKLVTDHEPMSISSEPIGAFLEDVCESFRESARLRGIELTINNEVGETELWLDHVKMEKVFFNLLSNAFKFTPDGGSIRISLEDQSKQVIIRVTDSGTGVAQEHREDIFKRFYEKSSGQQSAIKSSGIGLAISRQMVSLHHGKIYVAEAPAGQENGAEFVVELLKGKAHFKNTEVSEYDFSRPAKEVVTSPLPNKPPEEYEVETAGSSSATLLIVDDNEEIRNYLVSIFASTYNIVSADSGVSGLEQARAALPDVIISDVMMPEMDGLAFCHAVKTDLQISHIPVLLLTARTAEPFRIEGLRTGADDYLTKPFHPEELQLRVGNIIRSRIKAKEKFARVIALDPSEITITNADEQFLEQAMGIVEEQMGNTNFKVDAFATQLAVSRSLLFTKLKALTGMTPNNFIKSVRLKRAAQLLESGQFNVSQVAYAVGFKDPKYFRQCFKAQYGETPSTFGNKAG